MAIGLVALYGLNELVYRLTRLVVSNQTNLNDTTISAQIEDAPHMTLLIVIFLAPFVEEVLFRGLVFGNLRRKSAAVGYLVSCLLFALLHVWQFAVVNRDITYFLLMLQYLVPGLVLAWSMTAPAPCGRPSVSMRRPTPSPLGPLWRKNRNSG